MGISTCKRSASGGDGGELNITSQCSAAHTVEQWLSVQQSLSTAAQESCGHRESWDASVWNSTSNRFPKQKYNPTFLAHISTHRHRNLKKYNDSMHVNLNLTHGVCMHACTKPTPMQTPHTRGHAAPAAVEQFTQNSIRSAPNGAKATLTAYKGGGGGKQRIERLQLSESIAPALGETDTTNLARPR